MRSRGTRYQLDARLKLLDVNLITLKQNMAERELLKVHLEEWIDWTLVKQALRSVERILYDQLTSKCHAILS